MEWHHQAGLAMKAILPKPSHVPVLDINAQPHYTISDGLLHHPYLAILNLCNGQWGVLLPCISEVRHCFLARRHYLPYDWDTLNVTDRSGQVDASNHRHETCQGFPMDIEGPRSKVIAYSSTMPSDVNTAQKSTCQRAPMCTHHYKQHINIPKPQSWRPCKVQKSVHQGLPSTVHVTSYGRPTSRKPFRIDSHPRSLWCSHC